MPIIREATTADAAAIAAIYRPFVVSGTATFEIDAPDAGEMARRITAVRTGGYPFLVTEIDGIVAAYAYANAFRARPAYRFAVEDSIYVSPGKAGQGLGTILLAELIARCEAAGFRQMVAVVGDSASQAASIALHARAGFTIAGRLPGVGYKHGRWLDSLLMQRALGPGETSAPRDG